MNNTLMKYDPVSGHKYPYPSEPNQYRKFHGLVAWMFNPYTGDKRNPLDIGSDVQGLAIIRKAQ